MSSCESGAAGPGGHHVVPADFHFGTLQAPVHVVAPDKAELLDAVRAARAEADAIREEARAEGFLAGRAEAAEAIAPAAQALAAAADELRLLGQGMADRCEAKAVDLGLAVAEKILSATLAVEPERVLDAIRGALRGIVERERITVMVNPADLDLVRESMNGLVQELGGIEHCIVESERRVGRGGAMIRTTDGDVDARVETKLLRARQVVEAALRS